jgi:hypothetical protein
MHEYSRPRDQQRNCATHQKVRRVEPDVIREALQPAAQIKAIAMRRFLPFAS